MNLFSKAGVSVVEFREYTFFVDVVIDKPISSETFRKIYIELLNAHNVLAFQLKSEKPVIRLIPFVHRSSILIKYRWVLSAIAFTTIFLTGYGFAESLTAIVGPTSFTYTLLNSVLYAVLFSLVLLVHEVGHLYVSRRSGVIVEGPVLIPAPPIQLGFLGTFGALIFAKTPPCSRRDLARMGLFGPLFGFVAATLVGVLGVFLSPTISYGEALRLIEEGVLTSLNFTSLGFYLITLIRPLKPTDVLILHPVLFVTYVVYFITFLNLLPIGQLDGGHVLRSITGSRVFNFISMLVPTTLLSVGLLLLLLRFEASIYLGLGVVALVLYLVLGKRGHPGVANQYDESKCYYCIVAYIVLLVLTAPIPITA